VRALLYLLKTTLISKVPQYNKTENTTLDLVLPENSLYATVLKQVDNSTYTVKTVQNRYSRYYQRNKSSIYYRNKRTEIPLERTIIYKYNDNVSEEMYNYLDIVPEVTTE
jgi:hypothetical protein